MKKLALHWKIIIGLVLGILWAFLALHFGWHKFTLNWIAPWGEIFIRMLKLIAIPLVMFSIITGIAGLADLNKLGRMGSKTLFIYLCTTVLAVTTGLLVVNLLKPGTYVPEDQKIKNRILFERWQAQHPEVEPVDNRRVLGNPEYAAYQDIDGDEMPTEPEARESLQEAMAVEIGPLDFMVEMVPDNIVTSLSDNSLLLQVIVFAILFGICLKQIPAEHNRNLTQLFEGLNIVYLKFIDMVMLGAPFFVFCLMAGNLVEMSGDSTDDLISLLSSLLKYGLTVIAGLGLLIFIAYPSAYALFGYYPGEGGFFQRYIFYFRALGPAQLLAFTTSSSAATLPLTMECVHEKMKVSRETSSFVLPIGATINMDGTSLYQAVAVVYLAQLHWVDLTVAQQVTVVLTATLASIGSAAVPSAGIIMLILVLQSVNLNPAWVAIVLPIDRILDMCRTTVNVSGDGLVSSLVERWEAKHEPATFDGLPTSPPFPGDTAPGETPPLTPEDEVSSLEPQ